MKPKLPPRRAGPGDSEIEPCSVLRCQVAAPTELRNDLLAREEPLEIRVRGRCFAVTMRTPGHDEELAAGFLLGEGIVRNRGDIIEIGPHRSAEGAGAENLLNVFLAPSVEVDFEKLARHVYASSSCGLCGKVSIESVHQHFAPLKSAFTLPTQILIGLPTKLRTAQSTFGLTGGSHAAAIFDERGELVVLREDVGRHNAVDKALGHGFLNEFLPFQRHVLLVSGRSSFEIVQKALAARIPIVAAVSAPSSLAVAFAKESGLTLAGFLREGSFNLYSHPERIIENG